jgi:ribosome-associated toxin RatA of RatAB toxin-antitoxin module
MMHCSRAIFLSGLLGALVVIPNGAAAADDEAAKLEARGDAMRYTYKTTSPPNSIDTGGAAIFVNAPYATVRQIVLDYRHYTEFMKPLSQSKVLSRKNGVSELYMEAPILHGAAKVWAVVQVAAPTKEGAGEKIDIRYLRGNVDDLHMVWRMRPVDATHTVLKLDILVDPTLPVPSALVTPELSYAADKAVTAVRDKAAPNAAPITPAAGAPSPKTSDVANR